MSFHVAINIQNLTAIFLHFISGINIGKYAKDAQPDVLVTLIQSFVERIYVVDENNERYCHIFIKGCTKEDYDEFFRATGYISTARESSAITSKLPLCDSDECSKHNMILTIPLRM